MRITTKRFGKLDIPCDQLFLFPAGLIGMENRRQWVLVPDPTTPTVAWLQSTTRGDCALPMISPRTFFSDYKVRVADRDLSVLRLRSGAETFILTTVSEHAGAITTNLRAPVLLNLQQHLGAQLITTDDQPVRQSLPQQTAAMNSAAAASLSAATGLTPAAASAGSVTELSPASIAENPFSNQGSSSSPKLDSELVCGAHSGVLASGRIGSGNRAAA